MLGSIPRFVCAVGLLVATALPSHAWLPGTSQPRATGGFLVDTRDRRDVLGFYHTVYTASEGAAARMNWNGDVYAGDAGTTSREFRDDVLRRVNFYRAMVGVPASVVFRDANNAKAQQMALMMSANNAMSHDPPRWWLHYTDDGREAGANSNLVLGGSGPYAVDLYMIDYGEYNGPVGHRRWVLHAGTRAMGTGDVPASRDRQAANALWVGGDIDSDVPPFFLAWPNAGYVPDSLVPARWSLGYRFADFSRATVTMTRDGVPVPLNVVSRTNDYAERTIVWEPEGLPAAPLGADVTYEVTVSGITSFLGLSAPATHTYTVTMFNPAQLGETVAVTGPPTASLLGQTYRFNSITGADAYQLRVSRAAAADWTEGAEDVTASSVIDGTSAAYDLRQSRVVFRGAKSFQLTFANFEDGMQSFVVNREIVPSATSRLEFHEKFGLVATTTRLSAEVSTDNGLSWTEVWGRNGGTGQDAAFQARSVGLSAYAGKHLLVRFALRFGGPSYVGTTASDGAFIDAISVTDALALVETKDTQLDGNAASFVLDGNTVGAPLAPGASYYLRLRPQVGTRWFGDGPLFVVTAADVPLVPVPSPTLSLSASLDPFSATAGSPSPVQGFSVSGASLAGQVVVTAPSGFEMTRDGRTYSSRIVLDAAGGTLASENILLRLASSPSVASFAGNVVATSGGAGTRQLAVSGAVREAPLPETFLEIGGVLRPFSSARGLASAAQTLQLEARALQDNIRITASAGFEVSLDGFAFFREELIGFSGSTTHAATVYVRFAPLSETGSVAGEISFSSTGAQTIKRSVSGSVGGGASPVPMSLSYHGLIDLVGASPADAGAALAGLGHLSLRRTGQAYSAMIALGGRIQRFKGTMPPDGAFSFHIDNLATRQKILLSLDFSADGLINVASRREGDTEAGAVGVLRGAQSTGPFVAGQRIHCVFPPEQGSARGFGYGFAALQPRGSGLVALHGRLADGTAFTRSLATVRGDDGKTILPAFIPLRAGRGLLAGEAVLQAQPSVPGQPHISSENNWWWVRASIGKTGGGSNATLARTSLSGWLWTPANLPSGQSFALAVGGEVSPSGVWTEGRGPEWEGAPPKDFRFSFVRSSGLFHGQWPAQSGGKPLRFHGLLLPRGSASKDDGKIFGAGFVAQADGSSSAVFLRER